MCLEDIGVYLLCSCFCFIFPDVVMSKSATVSITFEVGKVTFLELPEFFDHGSIINGKESKSSSLETFTLVPFPSLYLSQQISASFFSGTPIPSKAVYLLDGSQWSNKLLLNLMTNQNGLTAFSLNTADLPKADLSLVVRFLPFIHLF